MYETRQWSATRDFVSMWVPIFFLSILVEMAYFWTFYRQSKVYRTNDSLSSLTLGSLNQLTKKLFGQVVLLHGPYKWIWYNYGQQVAESVPLLQNHFFAWWVMLVAVDFAYYCE